MTSLSLVASSKAPSPSRDTTHSEGLAVMAATCMKLAGTQLSPSQLV